MLGTVFFSAFLTPAVFSACLALFPTFPWPFSRVYDRVAMLVAALLIFFYRKEFQLREVRELAARELNGAGAVRVFYPFILALVTSVALLPLFVDGQRVMWNVQDSSYYFMKAGKVLAGALLVGVIEEVFFRFLLLKTLIARFSFLTSAFLSSVLYASVHFIRPDKSWEYPGFGLTVGLDYLIAVVRQILEGEVLFPWIGLLVVGLVLCTVVHRTKSIAVCIGLHAGWIAAVKVATFSTSFSDAFRQQMGGGGRFFLVSQPFSWLAVLAVGLLVLRLAKPLNDRQGTPG